MMDTVLDKDIIENEIVPTLSKAKRGYVTKSDITEIVNAILYKIKTGCQWKTLPCKSLFSGYVLSWQAVYHHFREWAKNDDFSKCWCSILKKYKSKLDLSSSDLDGFHSKAVRGGEQVEYQGRKKCKTTNSLFMTDRNGIPVAMSDPIAGNHHDVYQIKRSINKMINQLKDAGISYAGLFLNADGGFDCNELDQICNECDIIHDVDENKRNKRQDYDSYRYFDEELYGSRYMIERTNAWLDSFRSVLIRFDTTVISWKSMNIIACFSICLKELLNK